MLFVSCNFVCKYIGRVWRVAELRCMPGSGLARMGQARLGTLSQPLTEDQREVTRYCQVAFRSVSEVSVGPNLLRRAPHLWLSQLKFAGVYGWRCYLPSGIPLARVTMYDIKKQIFEEGSHTTNVFFYHFFWMGNS